MSDIHPPQSLQIMGPVQRIISLLGTHHVVVVVRGEHAQAFYRASGSSDWLPMFGMAMLPTDALSTEATTLWFVQYNAPLPTDSPWVDVSAWLTMQDMEMLPQVTRDVRLGTSRATTYAALLQGCGLNAHIQEHGGILIPPDNHQTQQVYPWQILDSATVATYMQQRG